MKKLLSALLALVLVLALSVTAFAAGTNTTVDQDHTGPIPPTTVQYSVAPAYTVQIPEDVSVTFNATSTSLGEVRLDAADLHLEPNCFVKVTLTASGKLKNKADSAKTIAYVIRDGNGEFSSAELRTGSESVRLTLDITQDAWNQASAGEYSDTVTFTVTYVKPTAAP